MASKHDPQHIHDEDEEPLDDDELLERQANDEDAVPIFDGEYGESPEFRRLGFGLGFSQIDITDQIEPIKPLECFEFKSSPNEFFLVLQCAECLETSSYSFRGLVLRRESLFTDFGTYFRGHHRNEVVIAATIDKDDKRPWWVQASIELSQDDLGKLRTLHLTDQPYPENSYVEDPAWVEHLDTSLNAPGLAEKGPLACRRMVLTICDSAEIRVKKKIGNRNGLHFREEVICQLVQPGRRPISEYTFPWLGESSQKTAANHPSPDHNRHKKRRQCKAKAVVIDLFSGCGGAASGSQQAGYEILCGVDIDESACLTFQRNFDAQVFLGDVTNFVNSFSDFRGLLSISKGTIVFLHISSPCQAFSPANTVRTEANQERNVTNAALLTSISEAIKQIKPDVVTIEQTYGLVTHYREYFGVLIDMLVEDCGYNIRWAVKYLPEFGCSQMRKRLIVFAAKPGVRLPTFPRATHGPKSFPPKSYYSVFEALGEVDADIVNRERRPYPTGQWKTPYSGRGLRPCVTTGGGDKSWYPDGSRPLINAELAALQGFPKHYVFMGKKIRTQIGNAVPPRPWSVIMKHVREELEEHLDTAEWVQRDNEDVEWVVLD